MLETVKSHNELSLLLTTAKYPLVVVEFFDTSDGLCKLFSSRLHSKINCADQKIELLRVDVLICPDLATHYKISVLPTILAFHGSRLLDKIEGCVDDIQLDTFINLLAKHFTV